MGPVSICVSGENLKLRYFGRGKEDLSQWLTRLPDSILENKDSRIHRIPMVHYSAFFGFGSQVHTLQPIQSRLLILLVVTSSSRALCV